MADDLSEEEVDALSKAMGDSPVEPASKTESADLTRKENRLRDPAMSEAAPNIMNGPRAISQAQFMQLEESLSSANVTPQELKRMHDIRVNVEVILGKAQLPLEKILQLQQGNVVELDKLAGEPVEIYANGKLVARAEVVVIEENFGIKILEIVGTKQKLGVIAD
jgi:flagellar motor switch protein FliN/FliY